MSFILFHSIIHHETVWLVMNWLIDFSILIDFRYFAIVRPMQYSRKMTRNRANGLLIFAWCLGLICALPPLFGWSTYVSFSFISSSFFPPSLLSCHRIQITAASFWFWLGARQPSASRLTYFSHFQFDIFDFKIKTCFYFFISLFLLFVRSFVLFKMYV